MHFEEWKWLVESSVLFPLTPALSLGERENRIQSFSEIRALDWPGGTPEFRPSVDGFICDQLPRLPELTLVYLDPPYFVKGNRLYENHYRPKDYAAVAELIQTTISQSWIVSYDNARQIRELYRHRRRATYKLDYSASTRSTGTEVMFFSDDLRLPEELYPGIRRFNSRPSRTQ